MKALAPAPKPTSDADLLSMITRPAAVSYVSACFGVLALGCLAVGTLQEPNSALVVITHLTAAFAFAAIARGLWQLHRWARIAGIIAAAIFTIALLVGPVVTLPKQFPTYTWPDWLAYFVAIVVLILWLCIPLYVLTRPRNVRAFHQPVA